MIDRLLVEITTNLPLITSAVIAGLIVELFFRLIKYKDSLNQLPPQPIAVYGVLADASNYMSVSQYLAIGNRKWVHYFLFRLAPPAIVFTLLAGVFERYFNGNSYMPYVLLAAFTSLLLRDIRQIRHAVLISEKLLHCANSLLVILVAVIVSLIARDNNLSFLAPSVDGLVDNLWSSLLVAMLVLVYLQATRLINIQDRATEDFAISNYVVRFYNQISSKYGDVINSACGKENCSKVLLYSILIYENMNRPAWLRMLENTFVRLPKLRLTVGIAQVKSNKSLTDEESIYLAAKLLKSSVSLDKAQFDETLRKYNPSKQYRESIELILDKLHMYTQGKL